MCCYSFLEFLVWVSEKPPLLVLIIFFVEFPLIVSLCFDNIEHDLERKEYVVWCFEGVFSGEDSLGHKVKFLVACRVSILNGLFCFVSFSAGLFCWLAFQENLSCHLKKKKI